MWRKRLWQTAANLFTAYVIKKPSLLGGGFLLVGWMLDRNILFVSFLWQIGDGLPPDFYEGRTATRGNRERLMIPANMTYARKIMRGVIGKGVC